MRTSAEYIKNGAAQTNAPNIVVAILLDYRAYDTLAAAAAMFVSMIGVITVMRRTGIKK
jgi:multisubunit Na+/H+ antiporter MnhB subunit